jgi:hypothetical protein
VSAAIPDWRDTSAYAPLLAAERAAFAWEWLRRDQAYRAAALGQSGSCPGSAWKALEEQPDAAPWGLHHFVDPRLPVPLARPVWRAERHPYVLQAMATRSADGPDSFALSRVEDLAVVVAGRNGEQLLLSDGLRFIRLDVRGRTLRGGPVRLRYRIEGLAAAQRPISVLRRLSALVPTRRFSSVLQPPNARARRHILLLRTYDALASGEDQRTIAAELLSRSAAGERWRVEAASIRSQIQRLVRTARELAAGGFWQLLL